MDGFLNVRLPMWARALSTRAIAIVPCIALAAAFPDGLALNQMINWVNALLGILLVRVSQATFILLLIIVPLI